MADANIGGYWKGVAVSRMFQVQIHVWLKQTGDSEITGKYESHDPNGRTSVGDLTASVRGSEVTFTSKDRTVEFSGQLVGEAAIDRILYGTMKGQRDQYPTGTLTLFNEQTEFVLQHYNPPPP